MSSTANSETSTTPIDETSSDAAHLETAPRIERASNANGVTGFVRNHPVLAVVGGITAGLVIGGLIPRRAGKAVVKQTSLLSKMLGSAAVSLSHEAGERANIAGKQIRKGSEVVADRAEDWTALALHGASVFAQSAAENIGKFSDTAADKAEQLGDVAAERIDKASRKASKRVDKAIPIAEAAASHAGKRVGRAIADLRARLIG